jgi:predicted homoserine dehydrogenase-like protein
VESARCHDGLPDQPPPGCAAMLRHAPGCGNMTVRVGLVGAGAVGARHARTLAGFDDVELVAIYDPVVASAEALAGELGAGTVRAALCPR